MKISFWKCLIPKLHLKLTKFTVSKYSENSFLEMPRTKTSFEINKFTRKRFESTRQNL